MSQPIDNVNTVKVGKITSNFARNEYIIFDRFEREDEKTKILGTIYNTFDREDKPCLKLYIPKMDRLTKKQGNIFQNSINNSLKELYRFP